MGISCHIEIDGVPRAPRKPYLFACLPRLGEKVSLEWDGNGYPKFIVEEVLHVPNDVQELPAFTVLRVRRTR